MTLRIYNTMGGKKEIFTPRVPGKVQMYVCGPTVYDSCHIGHARAVVTFDVIARYLRSKGFEVTYVRNFTDIDDKIIRRAAELGLDWTEITRRYIAEFHNDMDALNVERATVEPKATDHIDEIIQVIERLLEKQMAYEVQGDVYFAVQTFPDYGKLSGRRLAEMEAGARVEVDDRKRNPFDFALWKAAKPGEPFWESPWGKGRPGWHIECSAMSSHLLGQSFDIHGGGKDLIFPHHENEIAQSEGAFGNTFANFWIHNGFVNIDHEKMSKSLGNFLMIKDVIRRYHPETVRLFLLSNHYRSPIDFTDQALTEAAAGLDRMYALLKRLEDAMGTVESDALADDNQVKSDGWGRFCEAMDDDFNTALAIATIFDRVRRLNRRLDASPDLHDPIQRASLEAARGELLRMGGILGILSEPPGIYFDRKRQSVLEADHVDPEAIEQLIRERSAARQAKNWARADQIRDQLAGMGVVLEDRPDGTVWKIQ